MSVLEGENFSGHPDFMAISLGKMRIFSSNGIGDSLLAGVADL